MTPQEAAEQYANQHWGYNYITENKAHDEKAFITGQQWQSEQDNQALSSALKEIAELHAKVKEFEKLISSDSVWTLLRYGYKSPSSSGVDDCEDDDYMDLYKLSTDLKQANRLTSESTRQPDSTNLPPESAP